MMLDSSNEPRATQATCRQRLPVASARAAGGGTPRNKEGFRDFDGRHEPCRFFDQIRKSAQHKPVKKDTGNISQDCANAKLRVPCLLPRHHRMGHGCTGAKTCCSGEAGCAMGVVVGGALTGGGGGALWTPGTEAGGIHSVVPGSVRV